MKVKRNKIKVLFLSFIFMNVFLLNADAFWEQIRDSYITTSLYALAIDLDKDNLMFAGAKSVLLKSSNQGKSWQEVFITGSENRVNYIYLKHPEIYVVTDKKIFKSIDGGKDFQIVYQDISDNAKLNYFIKNNNKSFIASNMGLFVSFDNDATFTKIDCFPEEAQIYKVVFSKVDDTCLVLTSHGLYSSGVEAFNFKCVFSANSTGSEEEDFDYRYSDSEDFEGNILTTVHIDEFDNSKIYLGTNKGLFISKNNARTFNRLILPNFGRPFITQIINDNNDPGLIYVLSSIGFSKIDIKGLACESLYKGLVTDNLRFVKQDNIGGIWLATDKGLFTSSKEQVSVYADVDKQNLEHLWLQNAALIYNDVDPKKIAAWRKSLKVRALMPDLSLDYDKTINYDSTEEAYFTGPRDWGVNLSWDLADLIWNNYQDDIDTKSRLNTQLRINILDNVNRLYFERKRLASELRQKSSLSIDEENDLKLRIEALTANLDGYTGGYYSNILEGRER